MDAQERQRLVAVIKSFADTINHSRQRAESARMQLEQLHLAKEAVSRQEGLEEIEKEIATID